MELFVDEVAVTDYEKIVSVLESIYICAVWNEVNRLCTKNCLGCLMECLSERDHECLMLLDEDRWNIYGETAAEIINNGHSIIEQLVEASRVLRIPLNKNILERLRHLKKSNVAMMYMLWKKHCNKNDHDINCILTYLNYWRNK